MKKLVFMLIIIIFLVMGSTSIYLLNIYLLKDNSNFYEYFEEERLIGVDGEVNLSGIVSEKEELYREMINLFGNNYYDYEEYLKVIKNGEDDNMSLQKTIEGLSIEVSNLEDKKNSLDSEYSVLTKKYNKLKKSASNSVTVSKNNSYNFPLINQYPKYQTGCESVALTMLLQYYGVNVTPDMIISKLKKGSVPYWENGVLYGGNPELEFVGNPYSKSSYGTYEKPMAEVANIFKGGVIAKSNFSFNEVINLVKNGTPVMVWTSMGLSLPYISSSWIYKPTGETIEWKANEHAVVMIDATDSTVVIADSIGGKIKTYSRSTFESRYNYYGKKALYYL